MCTKTRDTYEAQLAAWEKQQKAVHALEALLGGSSRGGASGSGAGGASPEVKPEGAAAAGAAPAQEQQQAQQQVHQQQEQQAGGVSKRQGEDVIDLTGDSPAAKKARL